MKIEFKVKHGFLELITPHANQIESVEDAIDLSIIKWEVLARLTEEGTLAACGSSDTCGLCILYKGDCTACPIGKDGYEYCNGTPYMRYWRIVWCAEELPYEDRLAKAHAAAVEEIEYLNKIKENWLEENEDG